MVEFKNIHLFYFYEPYSLNSYAQIIPIIEVYRNNLIIYQDCNNCFKKLNIISQIIKKDSLW
jgi:hypothetical protein